MTTGDGPFQQRKRYCGLWTHISADFSPNSDETAFSLEEATLWVKDSIQVKNMLITDLFLTNTQLFTSQDVFISCLNPHYDGTHCDNIATFLQIRLDEETN